MKKNIAEDLPARKFPQASLSKSTEGGGADRQDAESKSPEKKVSQAVYDIRYRARRENLPLRQAYSSYIQNSSLSEQEKSMVREKLFGKDGIVKENYTEDISLLASNSVAKALYNVFVEKKGEDVDEEYIEELKSQLNTSSDRKYKVRVTDRSGVSYVRYANREKINSLRANPNIREVEMTEYGEPYEGEKNKGEQTAASKSGKDYDGDGKVESPAKEYRGSVHNAIQRKKGGNPDGQDTSSVKEEFFEELNDENTIDVKGKKKPKNKIVVHYKKDNERMNESSYSRFLGLLNEREMKASEVKTEKKLKTKYDPSGMKASMIKQYGQEKGEQVYFATIRKQAMKEESSCESDNGSNVDPRSMSTKVNLIKTRLRAAGARNPIVMVSNDNDVKEGAGLSVGISKAVGSLLSNPRTSAEQGAKSFQKNVADPIGKAVKGAARAIVQPANMSDKAQKERIGKYRPEEVEFEGEVIDEAEQRINKSRQPAKPRGTYDPTGIGMYPRTGKERKKMRKGEPVGKYPSLSKKDENDSDDRDHPSLSARERNPNLR
jgi:hypothetical protein